jgi:hypothetical protein
MIYLVIDVPYILAERPDPRFETSGNCTLTNGGDNDIGSKTCCWREKKGVVLDQLHIRKFVKNVTRQLEKVM